MGRAEGVWLAVIMFGWYVGEYRSCTLGEISDALRAVWGEHVPTEGVVQGAYRSEYGESDDLEKEFNEVSRGGAHAMQSPFLHPSHSHTWSHGTRLCVYLSCQGFTVWRTRAALSCNALMLSCVYGMGAAADGQRGQEVRGG